MPTRWIFSRSACLLPLFGTVQVSFCVNLWGMILNPAECLNKASVRRLELSWIHIEVQTNYEFVTFLWPSAQVALLEQNSSHTKQSEFCSRGLLLHQTLVNMLEADASHWQQLNLWRVIIVLTRTTVTFLFLAFHKNQVGLNFHPQFVFILIQAGSFPDKVPYSHSFVVL